MNGSPNTDRGAHDVTVHVKIPSWENVYDSENKKYTTYVVEVCGADGLIHILCKRYSDFHTLRRQLRRHYDKKHHFRGFPKKRIFFNFSESTLEERRGKFELYVNSLIELAPFLDELKSELAMFLQVDEEFLCEERDSENPPPSLPPPLVAKHSTQSIDSSISAVSMSPSDRNTGYSADGNSFLFPTVESSSADPFLPLPIKITGYINKSKRYTKTVKRWLFELKTADHGTTLTYYNTDETVRDSVDVLESAILSSPGTKGFKIVVDCKTSYPWVLRFDDEQGRDYWLSALSYHKAYGMSKIPKLHMGFMAKKGHIVKSWKKRFFILESTPSKCALLYYKGQMEDPPYGDGLKGKLDMRNYEILPDAECRPSVDGVLDDDGEDDTAAYDDDDDDDYEEDDGKESTGGAVSILDEELNPQLLIVLKEIDKKHAIHKKYRLRCDTMEEKVAWVRALEAHKAYYAIRHPVEIEEDEKTVLRS